ncbi:hypothetical protein [Pseudoxanthomonas winnipegensis]|uniref:hypothetical protein n=1 Tax=Pseudoxanthomonas winnipegensis TaxID=2480810 RepID=UPI003F8541AE
MKIIKNRKAQSIALLLLVISAHGTAAAETSYNSGGFSFIERIQSWLFGASVQEASIQKGNDDVHKAIAQNYR